MRSVTCARFPILTVIITGLVALALPLLALAGEDAYRLLELDGYKVKWGDQRLGVGARVSYAFAHQNMRFDKARNCGELAPIEALLKPNLTMETLTHETAAAFQVWGRAAGLSFHQVDDARNADIVLGAQGQPRGQAFANVTYAPDQQNGIRSIDKALVCLNPEHQWKVGFDGDKHVYDIRYTLIHEIGHAIGLDHPGPAGQVMGFRYTEAFDELQPGDLRGVQELYGRAVEPTIAAASNQTEKPAE